MRGKSKKPSKIFRIGKGYKTDSARSSLVGAPNSNLDFYDKTSGKLVQRRKFDSNGKAIKDLDKKHHSHSNSDHAHDFKGKVRGKERDLSKKERIELTKASKKRRLW